MACTPPRQERSSWAAPKVLQACYSFLRLKRLDMLPPKTLQKIYHKSQRSRKLSLMPFKDLWNELQAKTSSLPAARIFRKLTSRHRLTALLPRDSTTPTAIDVVANQPCRGERVVAKIARGVQEDTPGRYSVGLEGHTTCLVAFINGKSFLGTGLRALQSLLPVSSYVELQCTTRARGDGRLQTEICAVAVHAECTPVANKMEHLCLDPATVKYQPPTDHVTREVHTLDSLPPRDTVGAQHVQDTVARMRRQTEVFSWQLAGSEIPTTSTPKLVTSRAQFDAACEFYRDALMRIKLVYELQALGGMHPLCHVLALDIAMRYMLSTVIIHPDGDAVINVSHYVPLCAFSLAMKYYGNGINGRFALAPGWPQDCCDVADSCLSVGDGGILTAWLTRFYNESCHMHRTASDPQRMTAWRLTQREWLTFQVVDYRIHLTSLDLVQELVAMDQRLAATDLFGKASAFLQANLSVSVLFAVDPALLGLCLARIYVWKTMGAMAEFVQDVMDANFSSDEIEHCMRAIRVHEAL